MEIENILGKAGVEPVGKVSSDEPRWISDGSAFSADLSADPVALQNYFTGLTRYEALTGWPRVPFQKPDAEG